MAFQDISFFEGVKDICVEFLSTNYDYCYLAAMHEKNRQCGAETMIIGASHAMNGIIERELRHAGDTISFCVSSQDLYYGFEHIKRAVMNAPKERPYRRCLINLGYYMLYQDLSRSDLGKVIIPKTYMNLFGEQCTHHLSGAVKADLMQGLSFDKQMYPNEVVEPLCEYWSKGVLIEQGSYYGDMVKREGVNMLGVKHVVWSAMSDKEKQEYAKERTINAHNRFLKHVDSRNENGEILSEMVEYLARNQIKPYFFIMPYTKEYLNLIDSRFQPDIYEALDELDFAVEFIDLNNYGEQFVEEDFMDADHLNLQGARKATGLLDQFIQMAEGI